MNTTATRPITLPLTAIRQPKHWSLHQDLAFRPPPALISSIERFGILSPPIIRQLTDNSYELLCGAYRVWAAREVLNLSELLCICVDRQTSANYLFELLLEDQIRSQPLSAIEKGRALALAADVFGDRPPAFLFDAIGVKSRTQQEQCIQLLSLEEPIREALHRGTISEKVGFELAIMPPTERLLLCNLFLHLSLNDNKQRRVLELSRIVCSQHNITVTELFSHHLPDFNSESLDKNIPQQVNQLLKKLFEISHPLSSAAQRGFAEKIAKLKLPEQCSVLPSTSFEQDKVTLTIEYANIDTLSQAWKHLQGQIRTGAPPSPGKMK